MKQESKIITKYKNGALGEGFLESVKNADEEDVRVLLAAILLEEKDGEVDPELLRTGLGISEAELSASVKFWRGAGLLDTSKRTSKKISDASKQGAEEKKPEKTDIESAHRGGKLERDDFPSYTTEELTALMKKRSITSDFIGEASRVYGKIFNQHEVEMIVRMIDYIGFDGECVLMLLSFFAKEKKTLRYIEKTALALYDEGISSAAELQEKLCAMERVRTCEGQIRAMFGMTGRSLTTKEKKYISTWLGKMNFDVEMIRLAYEKTVDATHSPSCAYANGILERWFADGIDTPQKVADADEKRSSAKAAETGSSFDTDDFFEAALKRSYENI